MHCLQTVCRKHQVLIGQTILELKSNGMKDAKSHQDLGFYILSPPKKEKKKEKQEKRNQSHQRSD